MFMRIWMQMKFVEIFWYEVKIDALIGEGDTSKREMVILFSWRQVVKATCGYYKCKINIPMFNCIICQIYLYLFNTVIISSPLFSAYYSSFPTFLWRRVPQRLNLYTSNCINSNPSINYYLQPLCSNNCLCLF